MTQWLRFYFDLCLLKAAPQDAPASKSAFYTTIFAYIVLGTFLTSFNQSLLPSIIVALLQTALFVFVTNLIMWIKKTPERFIQTVTALLGTGVFIATFAIPIVVLGTSSPEGVETQSPISFLWMLSVVLIVWETVVIAHILHHAMVIPKLAAYGAALIYMYLSFTVTIRILKVMSYSLG